MRDHNREYQDNEGRKYSYDFDTVIRQHLLTTLAPHFNRGGATLEVGCFKGDMTAQILGYFDAVTVLEASSELSDIVRRRFPEKVTVVTSTIEEADIHGRFDNIFLVHTLEHFDDPVGLLTKMRGWLSPVGRLFVAVPNANALSRQIAVKMGLVDYHSAVTQAEAKHGHRRTYSMDTFLAHLRQSCCEVKEYGGVLVKTMANFQFDRALEQGIVDEPYLVACNELAKTYPELAASLYAVCAPKDA